MKSIFSSCHMCGSYDSEVITPAFLADGSFCKWQQILICRNCGLVFKNPVIPELNNCSYSKSSWGDGGAFKKRISELVSYLVHSLPKVTPEIVLEIGPGPGWLVMALQEQWEKSKFILLEGSPDVAELTKKNLPMATVVPSSIEDVTLGRGFVDLALVCGVDYLFANYSNSMEKIYNSLSEQGYLYVERNVFVESEAYVGHPIKSYKDMFGANVLMTSWFSTNQYKYYLSKRYEIISERSFVHDETEGHKCVINGFLCKKKVAIDLDTTTSWYQVNLKSLNRLESSSIGSKPRSHIFSSLLNLRKKI